jgi:4,5-dihydroxyphthalate decarboxylase
VVHVRAAFARYPHTAAILDGSLSVPGFEFTFEHSDSIVQAYRRMARDGAFGACEMAPVTYLAARAAGAPIVGLPIFTFRRFHHGDLWCPADSDIAGPADLQGRRVGVRAYSVTSAMWARGIWMHDYGVDLDRISWVTDDDENVTTVVLPPTLERLSASSLREEYNVGRLDACFAGVAGLGREGAPTSAWGTDAVSRQNTTAIRDSRSVIADPEHAEADWYQRTGIYPLHGMVVVHRDLAQQHPEIGAALVELFSRAKAGYLSALGSRPDSELTPDDRLIRRNQSIVGGDPLPFGVAENAAALAALVEFSVEQGLIPRPDPLEDLLADVRT